MKITKATKDDWKVIQQLNSQVFLNDEDHDDDLDLSWPFSEAGIKYYKNLADGSYGHCLIVCIEDEPVGYVALAIKDFGYRKSKYVEVENIGVCPEHRSKGIGESLICASEEWALKQGAKKLYVAAYWKNKKAIQFYKRNGFEEIGLELEKEL
ncbi:hypothetical protein A3I56_00395 [Candidatus Roizmanbacteria bacterium RIFCSPLOWO2_02_FULL_43_10]|uniref:N-acetyltransferase domain-containing protein n=3 Tax=Candidatus Roizmaniibacteriota TaxID=1752723 RepID=A0A1F7K1M6_9BACT|nr:MAG: hypothetical protein A3D08_00290 [Candidatus Roizmanbacteria bacterium RIFCSPHIGHO2_02_FULL_43_11]OGK37937.1 MAG: hypothetical protein A3F32_02120 [Candidatus Roizmanbacteria bacterium RIFCSPHIGHO2_12_FULL_42_10]OGK61773.1 MAG: hypothetical protein A3I56_00395 [Candidatus Roizmanbacteria bacterium RIFCSPLOWO2_02_FULL_43_10]